MKRKKMASQLSIQVTWRIYQNYILVHRKHELRNIILIIVLKTLSASLKTGIFTSKDISIKEVVKKCFIAITVNHTVIFNFPSYVSFICIAHICIKKKKKPRNATKKICICDIFKRFHYGDLTNKSSSLKIYFTYHFKAMKSISHHPYFFVEHS